MSAAIRLHPADNVVVACRDVAAGTTVADGVVAGSDIPFGHKIATAPIPPAAAVIKLGAVIGAASAAIAPGAHVHTHNLTSGAPVPAAPISPAPHAGTPGGDTARRGFMGFHRPDGRVGTRNFIGVISSVNCAASVVRFVCHEVEKRGLLAAYPNIDGIVPCTHTTGCGMIDGGEGLETLQRTLWGYARHPNFAAVLMIGLGCEVNQIPKLMDAYGLVENDRFAVMHIQDSGGTRQTVAAGVARIAAMLPAAGAYQRRWAPASHLSLALQCGGSDGHSAITANPALGVASDLLVAQGATVILSETPEIYGAEHILIARSRSPAVAARLQDRLSWWKDHVARHGGTLDHNPSPGNKAGGLTTIVEKSLGATAKGGTSLLGGVYRYAEPIDMPGLVFMDSPGYDPCAVTGQVAAGATLICFTTGRGSVFGGKPAPSLKVASNSRVFARMQEDMDINAGTVADGVETVAEVGRRIFEALLDCASGTPTKSEDLEMGNEEFVPWQIGVVL